MNRSVAEKAPMSIDYPRPGEVVAAPRYSLRISAADQTAVRVSIDGGPWQPCRRASGFWWYDWSDYRPGYHLLSAQASTHDGRIVALEARHVSVDLGDEPPSNPLSPSIIVRRRRHA